jgi:hypothetical protein
MNKYLMLSAAAVFAGAAPATAAVHGFAFGTLGGAPVCDTASVVTNGSVWAWQHDFTNCGSSIISTGQGLLSKVEGVGKGAMMSDNHTGNYTSVAISYWLPKSLRPGKIWSLWVEFSGISSFKYESGILLGAAPVHKAAPSTLTRVQSLIRAHRDALRSASR